jgi:hypothetical protein
MPRLIRRAGWFRLAVGILQIAAAIALPVALLLGARAPILAGLLTACVGFVALSRFWWRGR